MTSPGGGFNLATVYVQVLPSMRGFGPALGGPAGAAGGAAGTRAGRSFSDSFNKATAGAAGVLKGLTTAALGGAAALTAIGVKGAASLETTTAAFTSLLGSAQAATSQIQTLTKFAATTPFETKDIFGYAQQYYALADSVGLAKDQVIPFLTAIGDLGAVTGASTDNIRNAVMAIGQIGSAGKVTLENLNQISEAFPGFNGAAAIAAATGQKTADVLQSISKGEVSATVGIPALLQGMQQFNGAAGAMAKQGQTLNGTFSTFKDTINQSLTSAFTPLVPTIKATLSQVTPAIGSALSTVAPVIVKALAAIAPLIAPAISGLTRGFSAVANVLGPVFAKIGPVVSKFAQSLNPMVAALIPLAPLVLKVLSGLTPFRLLLVALLPVLPAITQALAPIITQLGAVLGPILKQLVVALQPVIAALGGALVTVIKAIAPQLPGLAKSFGELAVALVKLIVPFTPLIALAAKLAGFFSGVLVSAIKIVVDIVTALVKVLTAAIDGIKSFFSDNGYSTGIQATSEFKKNMHDARVQADAAKVAMAGFKDGLLAAAGVAVTAGDAVFRVAQAIQETVRQISSMPRSAFDAGDIIAGAARSGTASGIGAIIGGAASSVPNPPKSSTKKKTPPPPFDLSLLSGFVQTATGATTNPLDTALNAIIKSAKDAKKAFSDTFVRSLRRDNTVLKGLTSQREKIAAQLQGAQAKLANVRQQYGSAKVAVQGAIRGGFDIATAGKGFDGNQKVTVGNILAQIKQAVNRTRTFFSLLKTLKARGVPMALIQQMALAGVAALPQAQALASASARDLAQIKSQQTQLNSLGTQAGTFVADGLYKAGVQSAQGLVQGLESQQSQLNAAIRRLGTGMVKELKSVLKISSPSKVMHDLGGFTGEGFERGIASKYADVRNAGGKLGAAATAVGGGVTGGGSAGGYATRGDLIAVMDAWEKRVTVLQTTDRELARSVRNGEKKLSRAD